MNRKINSSKAKFRMSKTYKHIISHCRVLVLAAFAMMLATTAEATHIVGSDMSFRCLGNDFYEVTLVVRRDCINGAEDAPFDDPASVGIFDAFGNPLNFLGSLGQVLLPFNGADTLALNLPECAFFGGGLCVEEATYTGRVYLPFREKGYILAYQRCCRNVTLNNIIDPLEAGTSKFVCLTETTLNECNSSPEFQEWPEIIICANEELSFDHAAIDIDGDSLAYKLFTPEIGATIDRPKPQPPKGPPYDTVTWSDGFSLDNLLGGTPLQINEVTGEITAVPNTIGQFLVGVLVEEWRDGELLSKVRRDFEYNVRACEDYARIDFEAPTLTCDGLTVTFDNTSIDDYGYTWNFNYPSDDPSFVSNEAAPTFTFPEPGFYQVRLSSANPANDCEIEVIKEIGVFNSQITADIFCDMGLCVDGFVELDLISNAVDPDPAYDIESVVWEVESGDAILPVFGDSTTATVACADTIILRMTATSSNGCEFSDSKIIVLDFNTPDIFLAGDTLEICEGESIELLDSAVAGITYTWTPLDGLTFTDTEGFSDPVASPSETTKYSVTATNGEATDSAMVLVIVNENPEYTIAQDSITVCEGDLSDTGVSIEEGAGIAWDEVEGINFDLPYDLENPGFSESGYYSFIVSNEKCFVIDSIYVEVIPTEVDEVDENLGFIFLFDEESGSFSADVSETLLETYDILSVRWEVISGNDIYMGDGTAIDIVLDNPDVIEIRYYFTDSQGCEYIVVRIIDLMVPDVEIFLAGDTLEICEGESIALLDSAVAGLSYTWTPTEGLIFTDLENFSDPIASPADDTKYMVVATNGQESDSAMVLVIVNENPGYTINQDSIVVCEGDFADIDIDTDEDASVTWGDQDGIDLDPPFDGENPSFKESGYYIFTVSNEKCSVMDSIYVEVIPTEVDEVDEDLGFIFLFDEESGSFSADISETLLETYDIVSVRWEVISGEEVFSGDGTAIDIVLDNPGVVEIRYYFTDSQGCEYIVVRVIDLMAPDVEIFLAGDTLEICEGESIALLDSAIAGLRYTWTPTEGLTFTDTVDFSDPIASPADDTKYMVVATNGQESDSAMVLVIVNDNPGYTINQDSIVVCEGDFADIDIDTDEDASVTWGDQDGIDLDPPFDSENPSFKESGYYIFTVSNEKCSVMDSIYVEVIPTEVDEVDEDLGFIFLFDEESGSFSADVAETLLETYDIVSVRWEVISGNDIYMGDGTAIDIVLENPDVVEIRYYFTDSQGCEYIVVRIIDLMVPDVEIFLAGDTLEICEGESIALLDSAVAGLSYTWTPTEGLIFTDLENFSDPIASPADDTKYMVVATNGQESDSAIVLVIVNDNPGYTINQDSIVVCEGDFADIDIDTDEDASVTWGDQDGIDLDPPFDSENPSFKESGYYIFTVSNEKCSVMDSIYVEVIPTEVDEVDEAADVVSVFDSLTRRLVVSINEEALREMFDIVSIRWEVMIEDEIFSGDGSSIDIILPEGESAMVSYFITDSQGCEYIIKRTIDLGDNMMPSIEFLMQDSINVCLGDTTAIIANPNGAWTYTWEPEDDLIFPSEEDKSNPIFVGDSSRMYVVTVTDGVTTVTDSVTLNVITDQIELSFDFESGTICGDITHLRVNNPDDSDNTMYEWSLTEDFERVVSSEQFVAIRIEEDSARVYVRATDPDFFCGSNVAFIDVFSDSLSYDVVAGEIDQCVSDSTTVSIVNTGTDSLIVEWDADDRIVGDLNSPDIVVRANPSDTSVILTYTVSNGTGCEEAGMVEVPVTGFLVVEMMGDTAVCDGTADLTVTSQEADATYEWSLTSDFAEVVATGSEVALDLPYGTSTVYVRGAHPDYCDSNVDSMMIDDFSPEFELDVPPLNICVSNSTNITLINNDENQDISIAWDASENIVGDIFGELIMVMALDGQDTIELTYTVTNEDGCTVSDDLSIPVEDELIVDINIDSTSCDGTTAILSAIINASMADFEWSLDSTFASILSTDSIISVSLPESQPIYLRASTELCESNIASAMVPMDPFVIDFDAPDSICVGDIIMITGTNSSRDFDIIWEETENITSALDSATIVVEGIEGQDMITINYMAVSPDGCEDAGTIEIPYGTRVAPTVEPMLNCGTYTMTFPSGLSDGDVLWDFGIADDESDQSTEANPTFDFLAPGTYTVMLTSMMEICAFDQVIYEVTIPEIIELSSDTESPIFICEGSDSLISINVTSNLDLPIIWTNQNGDTIMMDSTITFMASDYEQLTATASDTFGCSQSLIFDIDPYDFGLEVEFPNGPDAIACAGENYPINIIDTTGANLSYEWMPAGAIVSGQGTANVIVNLTEPMTLTVLVTNQDNGCTKLLEITPGISFLMVDAGEDQEIFLGESTTITAISDGDIVDVIWDNGSTQSTQEVSPTETTTYTVTVTDVNGCTATDVVTVVVIQPECDESDVFLPTAFSPNNDGSNDELFVRSNFVMSMDLQIVNRWGQEVFRTTDQATGWNGRFNNTGKELHPDVYAYCVKVVCTDGQEFVKSGNVTLYR